MMVIDGFNSAQAHEAIEAARAEIERLEALFSLYRPDSAIVRLNQNGSLEAPDGDFLELLSIAKSIHRASSGAFDPTVQRLWEELLAACTATAVSNDRSCMRILARGREPADFRHVRLSAERVWFDRPGMAITLNGIAQGFITDRVAGLMRARGLNHVLVDIGEIVAIGGRNDGAPWPVSIRSSGGGENTIRRLALEGRALATSEPLSMSFDDAHTIGHILDPRDPAARARRSVVSVEADRAVIADALSTAFCLMNEQAIRVALKAFPEARLIVG
jgi:thiamine biosynthesis lipoprotein